MMLPALYNHLDAMQWRYSTQQFASNAKLDKETLYALLEILRLTPTAMGLQLWRFVLVSDLEIRKRLAEKTPVRHQRQILDASHLLVLCRPHKFEPALIDQHVEHVAYIRKQSISELHSYSSFLHNWFHEHQDSLESWMDNQVYLALGHLVAACAAARIDSCPIEDFPTLDYDEILELGNKHLHSIVTCAVGVRSNNDKYAKLPKVRYPMDDLVLYR
ncbi:MAG TPA: nitroreductase family protein [Fibrobacteraceae bacterium]|nr:nitroreductase family protein [Fibrobacteraceae bacterium]